MHRSFFASSQPGRLSPIAPLSLGWKETFLPRHDLCLDKCSKHNICLPYITAYAWICYAKNHYPCWTKVCKSHWFEWNIFSPCNRTSPVECGVLLFLSLWNKWGSFRKQISAENGLPASRDVALIGASYAGKSKGGSSPSSKQASSWTQGYLY